MTREDVFNPTYDVYDTRGSDPDGDLYFLLQKGDQQFMITLETVFECLKFAEENCEIEPLPESLWINAMTRYPNMYKGRDFCESVQASPD